MAKAELKTKENDASVDAFIDSVADRQKRDDAEKLKRIFQQVTGEPARMWGPSIIGFGRFTYKSPKTGREGEWMITGFSPRKNALTLYIMDSYEFKDIQDELSQLGKHKTSKGCLYINKLADVDEAALRKIIKRSVDNIKAGKYLM